LGTWGFSGSKEKAPGLPGAGWFLFCCFWYRYALKRPPEGFGGVNSMMMQMGEPIVYHTGQDNITGQEHCQLKAAACPFFHLDISKLWDVLFHPLNAPPAFSRNRQAVRLERGKGCNADNGKRFNEKRSFTTVD